MANDEMISMRAISGLDVSPIVYNGATFSPGPTHATLDYAQFTLAYEGELLNLAPAVGSSAAWG